MIHNLFTSTSPHRSPRAWALSLPVYAQYSTPMRDVDNGARQPVNFFRQYSRQ